MTHTPTLEDTQPKAPITDAETGYNALPPQDRGGPGCAVFGCVGGLGLLIAVVIVGLAGVAGWSAGQRTATANATATQNSVIVEQMNRIPSDLSAGSLELADVRIRYLMQLTPGVQGVSELAQTATAEAIQRRPTATPSPEATRAVAEVTAEATADELVITPAGSNGYDLAALLSEAETAVANGQYATAYEALDIITALDSTYEATRVRQLLTTALNGQARFLFSANRPAEAIIWATRAEDLGVLEGDNSFELYAATQWQRATSAVGLSYPQAIAALQEVVNLGPGRYYEQARSLLVEQYIGYGDAMALDPNFGYCPAVQQYQNAVNISGGGQAVAKRDNAQQLCEQATPTGGPGGTPGATPEPGQPPPSGEIAPVGQPGA